jgi:hypothetical protein
MKHEYEGHAYHMNSSVCGYQRPDVFVNPIQQIYMDIHNNYDRIGLQNERPKNSLKERVF